MVQRRIRFEVTYYCFPKAGSRCNKEVENENQTCQSFQRSHSPIEEIGF